jgi:predicted RNA binding protein YcfA (HicA-like mRNA interferase family)
MPKIEKLYASLLANPSLRISFRDFEALLVAFGFEIRSGRGSHRNYKHPAIPALLTIQPRGKDALPYQVKRLLELVRDYDLHMEA